jgi:DNA-binding MarR family transcriptional regulator
VHVHDLRAWRLLAEVEAGPGLSQRRLAARAGMALGLTNVLIRRMVDKGWVRVVQTRSNRVKYLLTPAGLKEKGRMSRDYLLHTISFYAEARARIGQRFGELAREWPETNGEPKRIAFYGTGEIAEIAYVCLQGTDLRLVAVIGDEPPKTFFGFEVHSVPRVIENPALLGLAERIVVMASNASPEELASNFSRLHGTENRLFWL